MSGKESVDKKLLYMLVAVVCIIAVFIIMTGMVLSPSGNSIDIYDKDNNIVAEVNENGDIRMVSDYKAYLYDYINIVVNEATEYYCNSNELKYNQAKKYLFKNVNAVYTHLDIDVLDKLHQAYLNSAIESKTSFASVVTDVEGRVIAAYGNGNEDNIVYSVYKTYAGSAIKPISVYAPGIEHCKIHWSSKLIDKPFKMIVDETGNNVPWPTNADGKYSGTKIFLFDAIKKSTNTVAVRLLYDYKVGKAISFLGSKFGINLEYEKTMVEQYGDEEVLGNLALGYLYDGVTPLDMAGYYQIFANGGKYVKPYAINYVEGKNNSSYTTKPKPKRIISNDTSQIINELLQCVVNRGGTGKNAFVKGVVVAGKSGTSDNYQDNWFVGCTPDYVCSVWHGDACNHKNEASSIFAEIIKNLTVVKKSFPVSSAVTARNFCNYSGLLSGSGCDSVSLGYYSYYNMPERCTCS